MSVGSTTIIIDSGQVRGFDKAATLGNSMLTLILFLVAVLVQGLRDNEHIIQFGGCTNSGQTLGK